MKTLNSIALFVPIILVLLPLGLQAQGSSNDTRTINAQYTGEIEEEDLINSPYTARWYKPRYERYKSHSQSIKTIKKNINDYEIEAFMGTWCPDSHREIPRFFKILELTEYDRDNLTVYTLNSAFKSANQAENGKNITNVPTIIFYKDGKEVNRFVEHAQESLARDMAKIVSGKTYKNYHEK